MRRAILIAVVCLIAANAFLSGCGSTTDIYRCWGDITSEDGTKKSVPPHEPLVMTVYEYGVWWLRPLVEWLHGEHRSEGAVTVEAHEHFVGEVFSGLKTVNNRDGSGWVRVISNDEYQTPPGNYDILDEFAATLAATRRTTTKGAYSPFGGEASLPWERSDRYLNLRLSISAGRFEGICLLFEKK